MFSLVSFLPRAIVQSIPLLLGCVGETLNEKSGSLNLGIPGVMYVGAICGVIGSFMYENSGGPFNPVIGVIIPIITCMLGALMMGLIFCFLTVTLRANQNVTGLAMTTFGVGFGNFFGGSIIKLTGSDVPSITLSATSKAFKTTLPFAGKAGVVGELLFSYSFMTYVAIIIAILTAYMLNKTRTGLELRAVGENPATADAAGININRYKYFSICIGCMIAGIGGLFYVLDYANGVWSNDAFGDRGWLAIALVIFSIWRPNWAIWESILFGGLYILYLYIPTGTNFAMKEIYKMLPYLVTIIMLIAISLRNKHENQPPEALGLPYFREDR
ncbi:MAG: ABC transporter permease [Mogibacterium sp.]|nr:ABC transporter permease [Mogibacterium sp.]